MVVLSITFLAPIHPKAQTQIGYSGITGGSGDGMGQAAALITSANSSGVVWRAGVNATEPIKSGLIFVDQRGCRTGIALANSSDQVVPATLILRDALGEELTRSSYTLRPRQQSALFLDELFPNMASDFVGSLSFESDVNLAAIGLRENQNLYGEPILSALPVIDLAHRRLSR